MSNLIYFVRSNRLIIAISLFIIFFSLLHTIKPACIYNEDGGFRPFGLGYRHKTVLPIWIAAIIIAIFSYLVVLQILNM